MFDILLKKKLSTRAKQFIIAMEVIRETGIMDFDKVTESDIFARVWNEHLTDAEIVVILNELELLDYYSKIMEEVA